jgi:hypothetical protein
MALVGDPEAVHYGAEKPKITPSPVLRRYIDNSVKAGLILLVVAVLLLATGALLGDAEGVVVATVGSALFTVAVLNFLFEPFQKVELVRELRDTLDIERSLITAGVRRVVSSDAVNLAQLVGQSPTVDVLPWNPLDWAEREFRTLTEVASHRPLQLRIFVPAPDDATKYALADRLRIGSSELETALQRLPDLFGNVWDEKQRHGDSVLEVLRFSGGPAHGLLVCDACAVLETGPVVRVAALDRKSQVVVFEPESPFAVRARDELDFPGDDVPPTLAGVRPLRDELTRQGRPHPKAAPERHPAEPATADSEELDSGR